MAMLACESPVQIRTSRLTQSDASSEMTAIIQLNGPVVHLRAGGAAQRRSSGRPQACETKLDASITVGDSEASEPRAFRDTRRE